MTRDAASLLLELLQKHPTHFRPGVADDAADARNAPPGRSIGADSSITAPPSPTAAGPLKGLFSAGP